MQTRAVWINNYRAAAEVRCKEYETWARRPVLAVVNAGLGKRKRSALGGVINQAFTRTALEPEQGRLLTAATLEGIRDRIVDDNCFLAKIPIAFQTLFSAFILLAVLQLLLHYSSTVVYRGICPTANL